ncbi:MAG: hypothetical protein HY273_17065 [Gammaproteobacteria bacterium]|nr:hypothetical protein [Gammaproteobacteria bacterium]
MTDNKANNNATRKAAQPEKSTAAKKPLNGKRAPRVISDPNQVAQLVMMHLDAVSTKKDEMTIAIKNLADVTRQLARAYAQNAKTIQMLQQRIASLERPQK